MKPSTIAKFKEGSKSYWYAACQVANCLSKPLKYTGTTSNLITHLETQHKLKNPAAATQAPLDFAPAGSFPVTKQAEIQKRQAMFVVSTCSPISVVENCSFRELCTALNPRYSATSNKKIKEIINATATQVRQHLKDLVRDQDCHLTTDLWQSITKNFFIAVTCHFVDKEWNIHSLTICVDKLPENQGHDHVLLREKLTTVIQSFAISVGAIVHDQGSNIILACAEMKEKKDIEDTCNCFSHSLHGIVTEATYTWISALGGRAGKQARAFKFAHNSEKLVNHKDNKDKLKMVMDVETRWNSTYAMFKRLLKLRSSVVEVTMGLKKAENLKKCFLFAKLK